jgi:hypothetical protein
MQSTDHLIAVADAYKAAAGVPKDQTVSYRVFRDSKKLTHMREGAGITLDRFNSAMQWFRDNWPAGHDKPAALAPPAQVGEAAAQ